ncbi:MAG: aspartate--ammonia ligase [Bacteroidaceae bacterium]|nr:aspartate--ammonia ligase [Bacteroidaceae bacterium]
MSKLIRPKHYTPLLNVHQNEMAIKLIKESFQQNLSTTLRLHRTTGPLFVMQGMGINDDLNGVERAVTFPIKDLGDQKAEVVHSLAKWKRLTLAYQKIAPGYGIYTDMNAIRADEELDNTHSLYVDQWDWEQVILPEDRDLEYLKHIVNGIYCSMLRTEFNVCEQYSNIRPRLANKIYFIHAEELRRLYPDKSPKERENLITKAKGSVFIIGIGGALGDGKPHDLRAPDYDDWTTKSENGLAGLNGDLLVWDDILESALELSSMGIRVDKAALCEQLRITGKEERRQLYFHKKLLNDELPLSIGGGIGQSRLCMFFLHKAHIGEVQASIWPDDMRRECEQLNIHLI